MDIVLEWLTCRRCIYCVPLDIELMKTATDSVIFGSNCPGSVLSDLSVNSSFLFSINERESATEWSNDDVTTGYQTA